MINCLETPGAEPKMASRIHLFDLRSIPMRTFHISWFTFFLCFFGWLGIGALMPVIRDDLHLSQQEVGYSMIGSVAITIFARLIFGWLCDRVGARRSYVTLLLIASVPLMAVGLSESYETFMLFSSALLSPPAAQSPRRGEWQWSFPALRFLLWLSSIITPHATPRRATCLQYASRHTPTRVH